MIESHPNEIQAGPARSSRLIDRTVAAGVFLGFAAILLLKAPGLEYFLTSRDHGYQLCIGGQVLLGKTPGVDIVTVYGPMAMLTSALGLRLSGSLLGETLLCVGGYSLCFALLYSLARRDWSRIAGVASACVGYALMARYYKWYVWLIPLATLWTVRGWLDAPEDRKRRWLTACGLVVGLSWLYRLDMGTFAAAAVCLTIAATEFRLPWRRMRASITVFLAASSVFPMAWMAYLAIAEGPTAPWRFLASSFHGALVVSRGMAAPMPPLAPIVIGYATASAVLIVALIAGVVFSMRTEAGPRSRFLLASALMGLAVVHQAMHRRDPAHLLQVVPPVIVAAFALLAGLRYAALDGSFQRLARWAFGACGVALACGLAYATYGLNPFSQWDLMPMGPRPGHRLASLARPLADPDAHPALGVVRFLREQTPADASVLIFPLDSQLLPLAERKLSGRLHGYYAGVFDASEDASANLDAILAGPPSVVVLPSPQADPTGSDWPADELARRGAAAHQSLDDYIRSNYTRTVYDDGRSIIVAR